MAQSNNNLVFRNLRLKALPALLVMALAACGGSGDQSAPSTSLAANMVSNPKGADNKPATPATPAAAIVPYTVTIVSPEDGGSAMNAAGQAIHIRKIDGVSRSFFDDGTTSIELPGIASVLNNNGQVAGRTEDNRVYFWSQATRVIYITGAQEPYVGIVGLTDAGLLIFNSGTTDGRGRAFAWTQSGGLVEMTLGGKFSVAKGVNKNGQVVGQATMSGELGPLRDDGFARAFIWTQSGGMVMK